MNDIATSPPIPLRRLAPFAAAALLLMLVLWLVTFDQGALSQAGGVLHELMHDGRHMLGVPCH